MSLVILFFEHARAALAFVVFIHLIDYSVGVDYGKHCDHDDDCHDFRLVCQDFGCVCTRFFDWDSHRRVCDLNMTDLRHFLASLGEERDYRAELDAQARSTFNQLGFAGILALSLGILGASCCVFLFCILDRKPRKSKTLEKKAEVTLIASAPVEIIPSPSIGSAQTNVEMPFEKETV